MTGSYVSFDTCTLFMDVCVWSAYFQINNFTKSLLPTFALAVLFLTYISLTLICFKYEVLCHYHIYVGFALRTLFICQFV